MDDCLIYLISENHATDDDGNHLAEKTEKRVFAEVQSISQKEFFGSGQADLKPEYKFKVWDAEYNGEKLIRYGKSVYAVYRTYKTGDKIELYVTQKTGV